MPTKKSLAGLGGILVLFLPFFVGGCSFFGLTKDSPGNEPGIVVLERKASPEIQGFNVYRVDPDDGSRSLVNSRLVEPASEIADDRGLVTYRVIDRGVIAGQEYYYVFEEVAKDGTKTTWDTPQPIIAKSLQAAGTG